MKQIEAMSIDECRAELELMEEDFRCYAEIGQGISTKETVRHRLLKFKVDLAEQISETVAMGIDDLLSFEQNARAMFAPVD